MRVFYNKKQSVDISRMKLFSPSAGKPSKVIRDWEKRNFPIEIVSDFAPMTIDEISLAHDRKYVKGVLAGTTQNGFGTRSKVIAESLRWTTGSFVAAAMNAYETGETTMSPTSGFHHAHFDRGGGFCTFNGLIISAVKLIEKGAKVGILDFDYHWGDGSADIIEKLNLDIPHMSVPSKHFQELDSDNWAGWKAFVPTDRTAENWAELETLPGVLEEKFGDRDIILYQSGADSYIGDPLGGKWDIPQMRFRDKQVFETFKKLGIMITFNLAGGYQENIQNVLDIHAATMEEAIKVYEG